MQKAVLFLTFNRLDTTQQVFPQIAFAKPSKLYIASDGPRENKEGEKEKVCYIRRWILSNISWDCAVKTRFLDKNSGGCGKGVSSAINWFFEHEEDGIILEDDTIPNKAFFRFCEELLDYHKNNNRIWHIAGFNHLNKIENRKEDYFFSKIMPCWGWATWKDRWKYYQFSLNNYPENILDSFSKREDIVQHRKEILKKMQKVPPAIDTWDYQWTFEAIKQQKISIVPTKNLVTNIGVDGVHYNKARNNPMLFTPAHDIFENKNDLIHDSSMQCDIVLFEKTYDMFLEPITQISKTDKEFLSNQYYLSSVLYILKSVMYFSFSKITCGKLRKKMQEKYNKYIIKLCKQIKK